MKRLISVILAMVMAMSFLTGCVDGEKPNNDVEPTPTPVATPSPEPVPDEEDPNYATVLAMWEDMNGYWVNEDGEYFFFRLDENGKAEMFVYDADGELENLMKGSAVMSSNKMSYYMAMDIPAISNNADMPGFTQQAGTYGYFIELEGYGDGYVKIADEDQPQDFDVFVYVGKTLDNKAEAIKTAEKLDK